MLKKFALVVSSISSIFMVACSSDTVAGGTIDPNSIAEVSSSSQMSSSAVAPDVELSSSSVGGGKDVPPSHSSCLGQAGQETGLPPPSGKRQPREVTSQ